MCLQHVLELVQRAGCAQVEADRQPLRLLAALLLAGYSVVKPGPLLSPAWIGVLIPSLYAIVQLVNIDRQKRAEAALAFNERRWASALITGGTAKKGDVLGIARIAGIQGAKRTADLIPLCHPLALTRVAVEFEVLEGSIPTIVCNATAETVGPTGVEMEALTAVQVALLTIYDMCKAADRGMTITDVKLLEKQGGKSGHWVAP